MRKFSEVLEDYLEERDRQYSDYYDNRYIDSRAECRELLSELTRELDEMVQGMRMDENNHQTHPTTPTHSWGKITETYNVFNGEPTQQELIEIHQWRRIDRPKQTGWFDDSKERAYCSDTVRIEGRTVYVKKVDTN